MANGLEPLAYYVRSYLSKQNDIVLDLLKKIIVSNLRNRLIDGEVDHVTTPENKEIWIYIPITLTFKPSSDVWETIHVWILDQGFTSVTIDSSPSVAYQYTIEMKGPIYSFIREVPD